MKSYLVIWHVSTGFSGEGFRDICLATANSVEEARDKIMQREKDTGHWIESALRPSEFFVKEIDGTEWSFYK